MVQVILSFNIFLHCITIPDKNFDLPDRSFHAMQTAWTLASYQSATDVKELIPEFFFLPEFLSNSEGNTSEKICC